MSGAGVCKKMRHGDLPVRPSFPGTDEGILFLRVRGRIASIVNSCLDAGIVIQESRGIYGCGHRPTDQPSKICQISKLPEYHQLAKLQLVGEARVTQASISLPDRDGVAQMDLGCATLYCAPLLRSSTALDVYASR